MKTPERPPPLTRSLLRLVLPASVRGEAVLGDLEEEYHARVGRDGGLRAGWWYRRQAWRVIGLYAVPRQRPADPVTILSPSEAIRRSNGPRGLVQDLRYAVRILVRSPGFSGMVVVALALGIGANTAIFSAIEAVLLRPLPFQSPDRVVQIVDRFESMPDRDEVMLSFPNFRDYEQAGSFQRVAAITSHSLYLRRDEDRPEIQGSHISSDLLPMMGVRPILGRGFLPEEDFLDPKPVTILSYDLWQSEFGGDTAVVGRTVTVNRLVQGEGWPSATLEVVGVMPPDFQLPALQIGDEYRVWGEAALFLPIGMWSWGRGHRGMYALRAVAELAPDVSLAEARQEMTSVAAGIAERDPDAAGLTVRLVPLLEVRRARYGPALLVLWGASALILLVVCANVASLLLGRALARERELAVRTSLGASRGRLFRQLLSESLILGATGAVAALLIAHWGSGLLKRVTPGNVQGLAEAGLNLEVLVFSAMVSLATVLLFGLGPAVRGMRTNPAGSLRGGARGGSARSLGPMRLLIVGQVAVSVVFLVGSGLLIRSLDNLLGTELGFEPDQTIHFAIDLPPRPLSKIEGREGLLSLFEQVKDRLEAMPGVQTVGGSQAAGPLGGTNSHTEVTLADRSAPAPGGWASAYAHGVSPGFLEAVGTPVIHGRGFRDDDLRLGDRTVLDRNPWHGLPVLVNRTMARQLWPDESPLGKRFFWGKQDPAVVRATLGRVEWSDEWDQRYPPPYPMEVVGVVADVKTLGLEDRARPTYYNLHFALIQNLYVRVSGDPFAMVPSLRAAIEAVDSEIEITRAEPLVQTLRESAAETRFQATLLSVFATLAVAMTGLGLFGVLAYAVSRRTHEMAVRLSLGAQRREVSGMIVKDGLTLGMGGIALGLGLAVLGVRSMSGLLYGVSPTDPVILGGSAALVLLVTMTACCLPAVWATRVEPMRVLREE